MQNYTYFTHDSVDELIETLTILWDSYGKINYSVTNRFNHDLVNISPDIILATGFGKWITSEIGAIDNCKFFVCKETKWGEVHIDGPSNPRQCAINIPIINCNNGVMNWFSNIDDSSVTVTPTTNVHTSNYRNDINHWNVSESMSLTQPALVRTHQWHNVDNRLNPDPRIVFSIRLKNNPKFEDVFDKLKPWTL